LLISPLDHPHLEVALHQQLLRCVVPAGHVATHCRALVGCAGDVERLGVVEVAAGLVPGAVDGVVVVGETYGRQGQ
jgi:hypothetical protein